MKKKQFIFTILYFFLKLILHFQCIKPIYILLSGIMEQPNTIIYNSNGSILKKKRKSNERQYLVTSVL